MDNIDLLAFGAHPDDVEVGVGGILAKHHIAGFSTAICNLTEAELSSNGTVELRRQEAQKAADILGLSLLINLKFPDRGLKGTPEQVNKITEIIRYLKPKVVLAPFWEDRHPDHVSCSHLVREAVFDAGLTRKKVGNEPAHRVDKLFFYFLNNIKESNLIIDVNEVYEHKMEAILSYSSQFKRQKDHVETRLNDPNFLSTIRARDRAWGHSAGILYGEALISSRPVIKQWLLEKE